MPKKSKSTHRHALIVDVKQLDQSRIAESARVQDADGVTPARSAKEIAMQKNWLAYLQTEDADISMDGDKKK